MHRTSTRTLLVSAAILLAGPAMAQATDKDRATSSSKQSATKSSPAAKPAGATAKRLDFVPSGSVKATSTQPQSAPAPAKDSSLCNHASASDA